MAKQNPVFVNSNGELEKIDGTTDTIDESLIQLATSSVNGLMASSDKSKLDGLSSSSISLAASEAITSGLLCYVDSSGEAAIASNAASSSKAELISLESSALGSSKNYAGPNYGTITMGSGLTVGATQFLGTAGALTETPPTSSGTVVQKIGKAIDTNKVLVDIESIVVVN